MGVDAQIRLLAGEVGLGHLPTEPQRAVGRCPDGHVIEPQPEHRQRRIILATVEPGGDHRRPEFFDMFARLDLVDRAGQAGVVVMVLADDAEMRPVAGPHRLDQIAVVLRIKPDAVAFLFNERCHRLHVLPGFLHPQHAGMNAVHDVPELLERIVFRLGEIDHNSSFHGC
jgi:hypothetical protein